MNRVQNRYEFFIVQGLVPAGIIRKKEGVFAWAKTVERRPISKKRREEGSESMVAEDYFKLAVDVPEFLRLDFVVGVTPSKIADLDDETKRVVWDYLSTCKGKLALVSSFDLRKYAAAVSRPFDAFLGALITGQLLVTQFRKRGLGFHPDRGCLFDYNDDRESVKDSLRELKIEPGCLSRIGSDFVPAAESLVEFFRTLPLEP